MNDKNCDCSCENGNKKWWWCKKTVYKGVGGHIYGLGVIGAFFYFLPHVANFQELIIGILKSFVWPALLVFKSLALLKF